MGWVKKLWKFYEDLEEVIGDSLKVNLVYIYDVVDGMLFLLLNVCNFELDEDSDVEDDEIGSIVKWVKILKSRVRKRKSYFFVVEMFFFLYFYIEKKEKVEEEKFNLFREMK